MNTPRSLLFALAAIVLTATTLLIATAVPRAQSVQESREKSGREFLIKQGESFRNYRFALSFRLPLRSRGLYAKRGNFSAVELQPADEQAFFIYHTSFRIRRESGVPALVARVYGPCPVPEIPEGNEFRINTSCPGKIGLNKLKRHVLLLRKQELLHLLVVTARSEQNKLAEEILGSVEINRDFCFEDKICPYR